MNAQYIIHRRIIIQYVHRYVTSVHIYVIRVNIYRYNKSAHNIELRTARYHFMLPVEPRLNIYVSINQTNTETLDAMILRGNNKLSGGISERSMKLASSQNRLP